ncbi:MAG TPA: HAMP domain-containing sensor histidine kinase [Gemmatimonadaceae bacterium]|nr:HAMP domain-containing sensor histidine kinase [Gemmatimonadaceae bacterium]
MKRVGFRGRLFLILLAFALVPSIIISLVWSGTGSFVLPLVGATAAWDSVAGTGERAIAAVRSTPLTNAQRRAVTLHETTLRQSLLLSRQAALVFRRAAKGLALATLLAVIILGVIASRVAGHLSRNLSRPLQELVGWTERIGRGEPLPTAPPRRGAPEFEVLRGRMRSMAAELDLGRARALEAERSAALRESARQVAHELKNPLTPIRFAVDRLRRDAIPEQQETVEVLAIESARLEAMARSFAQFGRLPEGPRAEVDLGELARYTARATIPADRAGSVDVAADLPMIHGHHDALARALSNVMLNAVDACSAGGRVGVRVRRVSLGGSDAVEVAVTDTGCGIPSDRLSRIWDPYVTSKPGGTGLGLAIARQTILAHDGRVAAESTVGAGTEIRFVLPVGGHERVEETA